MMNLKGFEFKLRFVFNRGNDAFDEGLYFVCKTEKGTTVIANPMFKGKPDGVSSLGKFPDFVKRYWWLSGVETKMPCEALKIMYGENND